MSLESKLANLSLGDETSVVDAIKAEGVEKSGFASNVSALCAAIEGKDDDAKLAALATVKAVAEGCPDAEAFNKEALQSCKYCSPRTFENHSFIPFFVKFIKAHPYSHHTHINRSFHL